MSWDVVQSCPPRFSYLCLLADLEEFSRMFVEDPTFAGWVKTIRISYLLVDTVL